MRRTCGTTFTTMEMTMAGRRVTEITAPRAMVTEGASRLGFEAIFDLRDRIAAYRDKTEWFSSQEADMVVFDPLLSIGAFFDDKEGLFDLCSWS
jgi:hypothetical protein